MPSLDSVNQKLYRAQMHFGELNKELRAYYETEPISFTPHATYTPEEPRFVFRETKPVPARIGLIAGDCLQNLRSALDYLVWELVGAAGNEPCKKNAFPVALSPEAYEDDLKKRGKLNGVAQKAEAHIRALQPFHTPEATRDGAILAVLDLLTNINKHRRVLLTGMGAVLKEDNSVPPNYKDLVRPLEPNGNHGSFNVFVAVQEAGPIKGMEIAGVMNVFAEYIAKQVVPLFQEFFL